MIGKDIKFGADVIYLVMVLDHDSWDWILSHLELELMALTYGTLWDAQAMEEV